MRPPKGPPSPQAARIAPQPAPPRQAPPPQAENGFAHAAHPLRNQSVGASISPKNDRGHPPMQPLNRRRPRNPGSARAARLRVPPDNGAQLLGRHQIRWFADIHVPSPSRQAAWRPHSIASIPKTWLHIVPNKEDTPNVTFGQAGDVWGARLVAPKGFLPLVEAGSSPLTDLPRPRCEIFGTKCVGFPAPAE